MLLLHVKEPTQAVLLEKGHWSCWTGSVQNFYLTLSYKGTPKMCAGVRRASVNRQT